MLTAEGTFRNLEVLIGILAVFAPEGLMGMTLGPTANAASEGVGREAEGTPVVWTDGEGFWGVSFDGPNPGEDQLVGVSNRDEAERLVRLIAAARFGS